MRRVLDVTGSPVVRWVFGAVAVALAVWAVAADRAQVAEALARLGAAPVALALLATFGTIACAAQVWRVLLADLGSPLPVVRAARIFVVAQLGKYLPGSLWPVAAQAELARDAGVPRSRSVAAGIASLLVSVATCAVAVLAALPLLPHGGRLVVGVPVVLAAAGVAVHPAVLGRVVDRALRAAKAPALHRRTSARGTLLAVAWGQVSWVVAGAQVWVLARALGADDGVRTALVCAGAYALAWLVGSLVFLAPAGAGARELTLVVALSGVLDRSEGLVLVLVSRVLFTVADLASAGLGSLGRAGRGRLGR